MPLHQRRDVNVFCATNEIAFPMAGDGAVLVFRGSHTSNFLTCGFSKSYNQAAQVPSSKVTCKSPRSPSINCRIMLTLVSIMHSITIFPAAFLTAIEILSLCTSMPIYFLLSMEGAPFCRG